MDAAAEDDTSESTPFSARRFGEYELLDELARGGMGVVYRARQLKLNRIVALKMILAGQFASKEEVLRFRSEAESAAHLQHPNIVGIHETGERDGHHYFSMDYVAGRTLADIVRDGPLPAQRAAKYTCRIAEAIHYAHSQGVLHRDLKPSNVIIDANDEPRITDFGLAKRMRDDFGVTVTGQVLGSPNFMPPEQTSAKSDKAGPASDVYGVGAILYYLLTARPPFHAETIEELLLQLRDADPVSPRLLNPSVPRDLETICLKCLEKDPARRYASAQALADELGRFTRDEPIQARPLHVAGKLWRWCRRRPAIAGLSASVILLLTAVAIGSTVGVWRVNRARSSEQRANRDLRYAVRLLELERAEDFFNAHDAASGVAHLSAMLRNDPSNSIAANRLVSALTQRGWALASGAAMRHGDRVMMASFSADGRRVLTASSDKTAGVWDATDGRQIFSLQHEDVVFSARYSRDGRRILTASADGTAQIRDAATGTGVAILRHSNKVFSAEFSPDGALAVTASADHRVRIWDAVTGQLIHVLRGHSRPVTHACFSPDGKHVASVTDLGGLRIWKTASGELVFRIVAHFEAAVHSLAFSPDGTLVVTAGDDRMVRLWSMETGEPVGEPLAHRKPVWHAAFSPDSKLLLTACEDGAARLWDVQTTRVVGERLRHESGVTFGQFSPDGRSVVTTSSDNMARVWDVQTQTPLCQPLRYIRKVQHAGFSPDNRRLVTASYDGRAQIWELRRRIEPAVHIQHDRNALPLALTPDGKAVLTAGHDKTLRLWDVRSGKPLSDFMPQHAWVTSGDFTADGGRAAISFVDQTIRIWNCDEWKTGALAEPVVIDGPAKHTKKIHMLRFSADASRIVSASADGTARVWNAYDGEAVTPPLVHHGREVVAAQFSPDGGKVVTASEDRTARIWDAQSGQPIGESLGHFDDVRWAEFSPNGEKVVTGSTDNTACLWDARTGRKLLTMQHARIVDRAVFSPDGRRIATACLDRTAQIWDAETGRALTPPLRHEFAVGYVRFSSDGRRLFTSCWTGPARLWDSGAGRPITEWLTESTFFGVGFDPVAGRVLLGSKEGFLHVWDLPEAPLPVPAWFPRFAEALAGIQLGERGSFELAEGNELARVIHEISGKSSKDFYEQLALKLVQSSGSNQ